MIFLKQRISAPNWSSFTLIHTVLVFNDAWKPYLAWVKVNVFRFKTSKDLEIACFWMDTSLIKKGIPLGSKEIAGKLNIHQNTVLKRLKQLGEKGLIYKQGSGPSVRYSI
jgi:hypothetical protein